MCCKNCYAESPLKPLWEEEIHFLHYRVMMIEAVSSRIQVRLKCLDRDINELRFYLGYPNNLGVEMELSF